MWGVQVDLEYSWGGTGSVGPPAMLSEEDFDGVAEEDGSNTKVEFSVLTTPHQPSRPPSRGWEGMFLWWCPSRVSLPCRELSVSRFFSLGMLRANSWTGVAVKPLKPVLGATGAGTEYLGFCPQAGETRILEMPMVYYRSFCGIVGALPGRHCEGLGLSVRLQGQV